MLPKNQKKIVAIFLKNRENRITFFSIRKAQKVDLGLIPQQPKELLYS